MVIAHIAPGSMQDYFVRSELIEHKQKNARVWFSRRDQVNLHKFPSAKNSPFAGNIAWKILHLATRIIFAIAILVLGSMAILATVLATTGISNPYFTDITRSKLSEMAGSQIETTLGATKLSVDSSGNLAFEGSNLGFLAKGLFAQSGSIGRIEMGLKAISLLEGKFDIGRLEISDVTMRLHDPDLGATSMFDRFKRPDGLLTGATVPQFVHKWVTVFVEEFRSKGVNELVLKDVKVSGGVLSGPVEMQIDTLTVMKQDEDTISLKGQFHVAGHLLGFNGVVRGNSDMKLSVSGLKFGTAPLNLSDPDAAVLHGSYDISANVDIKTFVRNGLKTVELSALFENFSLRTKPGIEVNGAGVLNFDFVEGVEKVEISSSTLNFGKNTITLNGAVAPKISSDKASDSPYKFELVSDNAILQPFDSPEKRLSYAIRIAGDFNAAGGSISFRELSLRTLSGDINGQGSMIFAGGSPQTIFKFRIPKLDVTDAKQIWPIVIAHGARQWVLNNVFGGTLTNSSIDFAFQSGYFDDEYKTGIDSKLTGEEVSADFDIANARFDVIGDFPPIRDASGHIQVRGADSEIKVDSGTAYLEDGTTADLARGSLLIPVVVGKPIMADLVVDVSGEAKTIAKLANREPFHALEKAPIVADDLSGTATAHIAARFPLRRADGAAGTDWKANVEFKDLSVVKAFGGQKLTNADGTLDISKDVATLNAVGKLNGLAAEISVTEPLGLQGNGRQFSAKLKLDDKARSQLMPGMNGILVGPVSVEVDSESGAGKVFTADLTKASLNLPWAGWSKGKGVAATATFMMETVEDITKITKFKLTGDTFNFTGNFEIADGKISVADFSNISLARGDKAAVKVVRGKSGYDVEITAKSLDLRGVLKRVTGSFETAAAAVGGQSIQIHAGISNAIGFNDVTLQNIKADYSGIGSKILSFNATATTADGAAIAIQNSSTDSGKTVKIQAADGGALLRFMDIYDNMRGGNIAVNLATQGNGPLTGEIDARNFVIVGEPRLKAIVGAPANDNGRALSTDFNKKIDVSKVKFQRGFAVIEKGKGYLKLGKGILRSDQVGLSYEGTLYDQNGRIDMNGTFLPAYGLNRIFGEIPIFGELLGNGRDKGLIGITFKLSGNAKSPTLSVNPISLIAPGIFRQIFEFK